MKKLSLILVSCAMLFACGKNEQTGKALTPNEQKTKVENTANELMQACQASDFKEYVDLGNYLAETYFDNPNYDYSVLEEKYEEWYNEFYKEGTYNDKLVVVLSQCTGEFTFGPTEVTYKSASTLKFSIKDDQNRECVCELVTSGPETSISYNDGEMDYTVKVPQSITVTVKRAGETLATYSYVFDLRLSSGGVNPSQDRVGVTETLTVNGYCVEAKVLYDGSLNQIFASASLTKNGQSLFREEIAGTIDLQGKDVEDTEFNNASASVFVDILGSVQLRGEISDFKKCYDTLEEYDSNSVSSATEAAAKLNTLASLALYFDNTTTRQAYVEFECIKYSDSYYGDYYDVMPVLVFNDGSRYQFEDYFEENDFSSLINRIEVFIASFGEIFDF
ncbi:MAG: hypothetical protein ACI4TM_06875 [Candidatus Cryptobacteroides sp.]